VPIMLGYPVRLTAGEIERIAVHGERVEIGAEATMAMVASREVVDRLNRSGAPSYGIGTGFGDLASISIPVEDQRELQKNLVRSHAAGTGNDLPRPLVRAVMALRAHGHALGNSGVRPEVAIMMCDLLNSGVTPVVPARGSVGASGDLAPLAHIALVLIGEGWASFEDERLPGAVALRRAGLTALTLEPKEGLSLVNGTQLMTALGLKAVVGAANLIGHADLIGAMSTEALLGKGTPFHQALAQVRPHRGQGESAAALRGWLSGSEIQERAVTAGRVQDAYSLRCMPQVHGAVRDGIRYLTSVLDVELNAVTDNPIVFVPSADFPDGVMMSGGNFHGQPLALALDMAKIAVATLAGISERRTARLIDKSLSNGLPAFLTPRAGLHSGYMVLQYTAASLVNEMQALAHPNSVHSLPTSANQEDYVSMGTTAGLQLLEMVDRAERVLSIEMLCAAQGIDFRAPLRPGLAIRQVLLQLRERVGRLDVDRPPSIDLDAGLMLIREGVLTKREVGIE